MISFIVPAHNEQAYLGRTLRSIHESARAAGQPYEVIVVDDASTDGTAEIARQSNARVVSVNHRQIAATRNSGARAASGERLLFVDADTTIKPRVVAAALRTMDRGAAGGGAPARFDDPVPLYMRLLLVWFNVIMRVVGITGGAFMFCTREAYHAVGGFDERLFGAEDAAMSFALKREGRFVVLWEHVRTSGRRARGMHGLRMLTALIRIAFFPKVLHNRSSVKKIWYESNRDELNQLPDSPAVRVANAIALVVVIVVITAPVWNFIPDVYPLTSPLGQIRLVIGVFLCHFGLLLWPCAYFLLRSLLTQTRWIERIKLAALIAFCLWQAWGSTRGVIWIWTHFYGWLASAA